MLRRWFATAALMFCAALLGASGEAISAAEICTDAERRWLELRNSDDVKTKLLADRWYGAVKLQEWGDASGKFRTDAKYVEHDPNLEWVKLRVIRGTGPERVVKEVTIPTAKLSKTCQARVRQINFLTEKMNTAATEEKERVAKKAEGKESTERVAEEPVEGDELAEEPRGRRARDDGGLAGMDGLEVLAGGEQPERTRSEEAAAPQAAGVTNTGAPLPALLPALPKASAAVEPAIDVQTSAPSLAARSQLGDGQLDNESWRTNFDAFRENIKVEEQGRDLFVFDWGPMTALQNAYEIQKRWEDTGDVDEAALAEISAALDAVGEVTWEATIQQAPTADGDWNAILGMPSLPSPWELTFVLDAERDPGAWQQLQPGTRVRFTGRFDAFDDTNSIHMPIRFLPNESERR